MSGCWFERGELGKRVDLYKDVDAEKGGIDLYIICYA
jgi:hypothetical protein